MNLPELITMESLKTPLIPGAYFPAYRRIPERSDVLSELSKFGRAGKGDLRLIDTSRGADDIRLHYIIDKRWVLRLCSAPGMTEQRLTELNRLIERYIRFGLRCPRFLADQNGRFFHEWNGFTCYLQEYIDLPTADELQLDPREENSVWREVLDSVAGFAEEYRNVDLSQTRGMYSLFDLSPYDIPVGKDEKQQNFDRLCETLRDMGESSLAKRLTARHRQVRARLRSVYQTLPCCVFQADENLSNVLVDDNRRLAGLIDFNMAGTEVIVNQFANLGGGFMEEVSEPVGAGVRMAYAMDSYREYQKRMFQIYHASEQEKQAIQWYSWIALTAGWPQVCFFLEGLKSDALRSEILELLALLADDSRG